jgi:hypothetical protein
MNVIYRITILFFVTFQAYANIEFDYYEIDKSVLPEISVYEFCFPFVNKGNISTRITNIKASCGCTDIKLNKYSYAPGELGYISGKLRVSNTRSIQSSMIRVFTDSPDTREIQLNIQIRVPRLLVLKPGLLLWHIGGESSSRVVSAIPSDADGVKLVEIKSDSDNFDIVLIEPERKAIFVETDEDGSGNSPITPQEWKIKVTPKLLTKRVRDRVMVRLDVQGEERVFYVHLMIQ